MPKQDPSRKSTPSNPPNPRPRPSRSAANRPRPTPAPNPRQPASTSGPLSRATRTQIIFFSVSALVVCSLLLAGVVAIATDRLSSGNDSNPTESAYVDPNQDIIGDQQTKVAENPDDYYALTLLANLLGNTGRLTEAIPLYEKALQMRPDDKGVRLDFARALADGGHRPDAEIQFKKLLAEDPNNQQAHYYLAEMYRVSVPARSQEAITEYQKAIAIDPSTYIAQQATDQLKTLGVTASPMASPTTGSPVASPTS